MVASVEKNVEVVIEELVGIAWDGSAISYGGNEKGKE